MEDRDSNKLLRGRAHEILKFQTKQIPNSKKKKQNEPEPRGIKPEKIYQPVVIV